MKKTLVFLFLCMFCIQTVLAQWSIGGKVGANWSKIVDFPATDSKQKMGWNIAAIGNYAFNDWFEIQGELLYSQRGANDFWYTEALGNNSTIIDMKSHYLDIPILVQFYPFKRQECFNIQVGIQPSIFLSESMKYESSDIQPSFGKTNPMDFGLIFGCAYKFKKGFFVDGRYVLGLADHYKEYDNMMKGRSIQLSVGFLFKLN